MSLDEVIFIENFPKLDLHCVERDVSRVMVNDFIKENYRLKNEIVVIIHGIGKGIIKDEVTKTLKKNKYVADFKLHYNNVGCTIVKLQFDK